jgi:hypothetical protein
MDAISRVASSMAGVAVTRTAREQSDELRNALGREIATRDNNVHENAVANGAKPGINTDNDVSQMFSYMNDATGNDNSVLWGSGVLAQGAQSDEPAQAAAMFGAARNEIRERSEALANEVAYASARGLDVSESLAAMSNLSDNLGVLDSNADAAVGFAPDYASEAAASIAEIAEEAAVEIVTVPPQEDDGQPGFAVSGPFEGSVTEQIAQVAAEQDPEEMSIAAQIASHAQAEHAESISLMNDENDGASDGSAANVRATDEVVR